MNQRGLAVMLLSASTAAADAQAPVVTVTVPASAGDSLLELNPVFTVRAVPAPGGEAIRSVTLQVDDNPDFRTPLLEATDASDVLTVRPARPLPHATALFWRASARTTSANTFTEVTGPVRSAAWVTLVEPNRPTGSFLSDRRPTFVWRGGRVTSPPGPFRYDVEVLNVQTRQIVRISGLADTVTTSPISLEFNTSYRWTVMASLTTPDTVRVESSGSFVILDERIPRTNLLYQNFPNPFPTVLVAATCIWFDLARDERVTLEVLDLRGSHVRWIVPAGGFGPSLTAGRYGRAVGGDGTVGCDPRLTWDGTTDDGRNAHAGVYLLRFRAGATETILKMLFRGR